jgi:hypothetical protein
MAKNQFAFLNLIVGRYFFITLDFMSPVSIPKQHSTNIDRTNK